MDTNIKDIDIINTIHIINTNIKKFHLTSKCKVNGFQATNLWIKWPTFLDKYQFVHIVYLETTSMKCRQNVNNKKNTFYFDLTS
jgi:hypothetical protein